MIKETSFGDVIQLNMGKEYEGRVIYVTAAYWVDGLLIDSGPYSVTAEAENVFPRYSIERMVNTHHHEDHIGNNHIIERLGIPIWAHQLAVPLIEEPARWTGRMLDYQYAAWELPPASRCSALGESFSCGRHRYRVIHTPGHSPDHIGLLEESEGWLFAGDIFLGEQVKMLRSDEHFHQSLQSLQSLRQYDFDTIFCGSGRVFDQGRQRLDAKIAWWEETERSILKLKAEGMNEENIRDQVLGSENLITAGTQGDLSRLNLVRSVLYDHLTFTQIF